MAITELKKATSSKTKNKLVKVESIDFDSKKNNKAGHMQTGEKYMVGEDLAKSLVKAGKAKIVK